MLGHCIHCPPSLRFTILIFYNILYTLLILCAKRLALIFSLEGRYLTGFVLNKLEESN